jgi:hypothetical protein
MGECVWRFRLGFEFSRRWGGRLCMLPARMLLVGRLSRSGLACAGKGGKEGQGRGTNRAKVIPMVFRTASSNA